MHYRVLEWHRKFLVQIKAAHKRRRRFAVNLLIRSSYFTSWTIALQIDDLVEKIYANMSACHLKNQNWRRAQETADKVITLLWADVNGWSWSQALAKNENNYKAMFRKGKALGEQGFFEKAVKVLKDLKSKNPSGAQHVSDTSIWCSIAHLIYQIKSWSTRRSKGYELSTMNARKCTSKRWKVSTLNPFVLIYNISHCVVKDSWTKRKRRATRCLFQVKNWRR